MVNMEDISFPYKILDYKLFVSLREKQNPPQFRS